MTRAKNDPGPAPTAFPDPFDSKVPQGPAAAPQPMTNGNQSSSTDAAWDHATHQNFYEYYAKESESETTRQRFRRVQEVVLRIASQVGTVSPLDVADIGCGAGTQSRMWAARGHRVSGLDVNEPLIQLARERAKTQGLHIGFEVGTATALPWGDATMDVCLLPELLEHVADWQSCIREAARTLRPGGLLYLSTTNVLCPKQQEFNLPLYSWYPSQVKRYCEHLAVTTHPGIANYAKYPAVNWFSFYSLRDFLEPLGFNCMDRFALIDPSSSGWLKRTILRLLQWSTVLRFLGHVASPGTYLIAVKSAHEHARVV